MEEKYIPKYLNAMPQILWWEGDEFAFLFLFTAVGIMFNHQFIGLGVGIIAMKIYSYFKGKKQEGYGYHKMYALGLYNKKIGKKNRFPEYWVKRYVR